MGRRSHQGAQLQRTLLTVGLQDPLHPEVTLFLKSSFSILSVRGME